MSNSSLVCGGFGPGGSIAGIICLGFAEGSTPPVTVDPGAYATEAQLIAREGRNIVQQASDLDNTGALNHDRIGQALADASSIIDGYLQSRYALPLTIRPPALSIHCCAIAMVLMSLRPTEQMTARYNATIRWLEGIAKGTFQLGITPAGQQPGSNSGAVAFTPTKRVFTQDGLSDFTNMRTIQ